MFDTILKIIVVIGIPTILGAFIYIGRKLQILDGIEPIKKLLTKCCNSIIEIQTIFKQAGIDLDHKLTEVSTSPLKPTLYGVKLIKESGLEKILDDNKQFLMDEVKKLLTKDYTEYDVQEMSRKALLTLKSNPILNPVKEYAFNNGMNIDTVLNTGGLWLKDDFLGQTRKSAEE